MLRFSQRVKRISFRSQLQPAFPSLLKAAPRATKISHLKTSSYLAYHPSFQSLHASHIRYGTDCKFNDFFRNINAIS